MKLARVFYGNQLYGEYPTSPYSGDIPDGAYLQDVHGAWFIKLHGSYTGINLSDVPKKLRAMVLLLA